MHQPPISLDTSAAAPTCGCEVDPYRCLEQMFVEMVQRGRIDKGQCPARRPVFLRLHGVAYGRFEILPNLPKELRVGLFGQRPYYDAWVRYSSDIPDGFPDLQTTIGIGIKLFNVAGPKILSPDEASPTADFLLQNHDVFFVDDVYQMCAFTQASLTSGEAGQAWLNDHPETQKILDEMKKVVPSVLKTNLWSCIPFQFGENRFCKYKLEPEVAPEGSELNYNDPNYLQVDFETRLKHGEARLRFLVQFQTDSETMPLDKATVRWSEEISRPIHVATLILPAQDTSARGQSNYGETLSFNVWRTLEEHKPVGTIADSRKMIYQASADLRRNVNGEPIGEPQVVRPPTVWPAAKDTHIVRAAIHPGIGVARIGNSTAEDGFYIGPEVTEPPHTKTGGTRDAQGAIKRQAARFRIYGYNAAGEVVGEIKSDDAYIQWTVHLVNRKAQWYQFDAALDIPETKNLSVPRRNSDIKVNERHKLAIDPGCRTIEGKNQSGGEYHFDTGTFMGTPVPLGEIRTDKVGRLLVLGGNGYSNSPEGKPIYNSDKPSSFNNADGWFDDISDGPVSAKVSIAGREIPVESSWVVVAPPNYAPDVIAWRTAYDLLVDTYVECGWMSLPETVSFTKDVLPSLQRLSNLQWVNKGFAALFGKGRPMDFENPDFIAKLAHRPATKSDPDPYAELRQAIFNAFRPANSNFNDPRTWPWIYGDAYGTDFKDSSRNNLSLSNVRMELLHRWVKGDFVNDWDCETKPPQTIDKVSIEEQPAMLDRAALHFCVGDAFHPGCEMTWPMRHSSIYTAPFRIRQRPIGEAEPDYGKELTPEIALRPGGPLYAQGPGDITRWMALPWQADTAFCRSGYEPEYDPYLPTFWPARVPNQVLSESDYAIVMNDNLPREERIAAYNNREQWLRALTGNAPHQMMQMVAQFGKMGIVEARPGIENDPDFPPVMFVESLPEEPLEQLKAKIAGSKVQGELSERPKGIALAGWESADQLEEFRRIVGL